MSHKQQINLPVDAKSTTTNIIVDVTYTSPPEGCSYSTWLQFRPHIEIMILRGGPDFTTDRHFDHGELNSAAEIEEWIKDEGTMPDDKLVEILRAMHEAEKIWLSERPSATGMKLPSLAEIFPDMQPSSNASPAA